MAHRLPCRCPSTLHGSFTVRDEVQKVDCHLTLFDTPHAWLGRKQPRCPGFKSPESVLRLGPNRCDWPATHRQRPLDLEPLRDGELYVLDDLDPGDKRWTAHPLGGRQCGRDDPTCQESPESAAKPVGSINNRSGRRRSNNTSDISNITPAVQQDLHPPATSRMSTPGGPSESSDPRINAAFTKPISPYSLTRMAHRSLGTVIRSAVIDKTSSFPRPADLKSR